MLLRWQTSIETPAGFWEILVEALVHTTYCGLLKQPDKQELANQEGGRKPAMFAQSNNGASEAFAAAKEIVTRVAH